MLHRLIESFIKQILISPLFVARLSLVRSSSFRFLHTRLSLSHVAQRWSLRDLFKVRHEVLILSEGIRVIDLIGIWGIILAKRY